MFVGKVNGKTITSKTLRGLKCKASCICNGLKNVQDEMIVEHGGKTFIFFRTNTKMASGYFIPGHWN